MKIEALLKTILASEVDNESALMDLLKESHLTEEETMQVKVALRALDGIRDKVPDDVMSKLMEMLGAKETGDGDGGEGQGNGEGDGTNKGQGAGDGANGSGGDGVGKSAEVVIKADGTADFSGVPKNVRPLVKQLWESNAASNVKLEKLAKSQEELLDGIRIAEFEKRASAEFSHVPGSTKEKAAVLKEIHDLDGKLGERIEKLLKASEAALKKGKLYDELGAGGEGDNSGGTAWDDVLTAAAGFRDKNGELTKAQAIAKVMKEMPDLYRRYKAERRANH